MEVDPINMNIKRKLQKIKHDKKFSNESKDLNNFSLNYFFNFLSSIVVSYYNHHYYLQIFLLLPAKVMAAMYAMNV